MTEFRCIICGKKAVWNSQGRFYCNDHFRSGEPLDEIQSIRESSTERLYVRESTSDQERAIIATVGKAVAWKRFPGKAPKDHGATFKKFLEERAPISPNAREALSSGFDKMRAVADKYKNVKGPMRLYKGKYYNAKQIAMMEAKERGETK